MDREKIQILIDTFKRLSIAPLPEYPDMGFNMRTDVFDRYQDIKCVKHGCGTAACIMGWTAALFSSREHIFIGVADYANLIVPNHFRGCRYVYDVNPEMFTIEAAVTVLERLLETGEVDWNYAIDNPWSPDEMPTKPTVMDMLMMESVDLPEGPKRVEANCDQ